MIVLIEKNANGKIEFTKEELEDLLEKAKQEGIAESQRQNSISSANPSPVPQLNPFQPPFTCKASQPVNVSNNIEKT